MVVAEDDKCNTPYGASVKDCLIPETFGYVW